MSDYYSTERALNEYLLFHYGRSSQVFPYAMGPHDALHFPQRLVRECAEYLHPKMRALDLGCAVGGAAFELARHCQEVVGMDASASFIRAATQLQKMGCHPVSILVSGNDCVEDEVSIPADIDRRRVEFKVGDAQQVLETFDGVLMANLIDRLKNPRACLHQMKTAINPNGVLIIATPYTWLPEYTPEENWIQGHAGLCDIVSSDFELVKRSNMPFLLREHVRKFQWSVADMTVWQRK